jgi:hypothetical protein
VFELVGGALTGSVAIISDAVHDFGDAITILVSFLLEKKSKDCGILSSWFLLKGAQDVGTENPAPTSCLERVPGIRNGFPRQRTV